MDVVVANAGGTVRRWLGQAVLMRHLAPPLYRAGIRRTFADELAVNDEG